MKPPRWRLRSASRTRLAAGRLRVESTRRSFSKSPISNGAVRTNARVKPAPVTYTRRGRAGEVTRRLEAETEALAGVGG